MRCMYADACGTSHIPAILRDSLWVPQSYFMALSPVKTRKKLAGERDAASFWTSAIFIAAAHIITIILKVGEGQAHNDNRRSRKNGS